jgi:hypothetical protein
VGWTQFWVKSCDGECALVCKGASFSRTIKELKFPLWYGVGEDQIWDSVTRSHGLWCYYHLWTSSCLQKPHSPCHKLHQGPTSCGMLTTCNWTFLYSAQNVTFGCKIVALCKRWLCLSDLRNTAWWTGGKPGTSRYGLCRTWWVQNKRVSRQATWVSETDSSII